MVTWAIKVKVHRRFNFDDQNMETILLVLIIILIIVFTYFVSYGYIDINIAAGTCAITLLTILLIIILMYNNVNEYLVWLTIIFVPLYVLIAMDMGWFPYIKAN
jgi:hypothetical protein